MPDESGVYEQLRRALSNLVTEWCDTAEHHENGEVAEALWAAAHQVERVLDAVAEEADDTCVHGNVSGACKHCWAAENDE